MQRRDFIAALGGVTIAGPPAALAQRSDRMWRVAVVMNSVATNTESPSYLHSMESDGRCGRAPSVVRTHRRRPAPRLEQLR
jgi:hypothetical protein